jgi:hypothetical protein
MSEKAVPPFERTKTKRSGLALHSSYDAVGVALFTERLYEHLVTRTVLPEPRGTRTAVDLVLDFALSAFSFLHLNSTG